MNKIKISKFVEFSSSTLALLTIVLVMTVSSASAKEQKPKGSGAESQVVAHISFSGLSAVDMVMQKKGERPILPLCAALKRPRHLDYRYQRARSAESDGGNSVAGSSHVEQDESDG